MQTWQSQEAKAKFGELVRKAAVEPQFVTVRGLPSVVVISQKDYLRLNRPKQSFLELMQSSPLAEADIDFPRSRSLPREVKL
ncbi:hypothetical protein FACS1894186_5460 [Alphaproteobacteria bacterium]|nr:hypothetical protein FACS1894186_5460 [Alphaproteobacteria bacterium]